MPKISEERREERRRQIIRAAMTCFGRSGIHTSSMAEVIAESGLSAGAVYLYFRSKDELIAAVAEQFLQGILGGIDTLLEADPAPSPAQVADRIFDRITADDDQAPIRNLPLLMSVWGEGARDPAIHQLTSYWITELRRRIHGPLQRYEAANGLSIPAETLTPALMALVQGYLIQTALGGRIDLDEYRVVVTTLLDSATPDPETPEAAAEAG